MEELVREIVDGVDLLRAKVISAQGRAGAAPHGAELCRWLCGVNHALGGLQFLSMDGIRHAEDFDAAEQLVAFGIEAHHGTQKAKP